MVAAKDEELVAKDEEVAPALVVDELCLVERTLSGVSLCRGCITFLVDITDFPYAVSDRLHPLCDNF